MTRTALSLILGIALFLGLTLVPPAAVAAAPDVASPEPVQLTAQQRRTVERLRAYLNRISTLEARFIQISSNGGFAEGDLYLSRPGRMRFEYDPPAQIVMVADGNFLGYYDLELDQVSYLPLSSTPASFLLRDSITFKDGVTLTGFERARGMIRVQLAKDDEPELGRLTVVFTERPLALRQWSVVDAQGIETVVTLQNPRFGVDLADDLFYLRDPERIRDATKGK
jgi:outer membrane lipoprotein-sorting protein